MGALTPNQATGAAGLDKFVQRWGKNLFGGLTEFFKAHMRIEDAVIDELEGNFPSQDALDDAEIALLRAKDAITMVRNQTEMLVLSGNPAATWHIPYFTAQLPRLDKMKTHIINCVSNFQAMSLQQAADAGTLQDSFWTDGSNSQFRIESKKFIQWYGAVIKNHLTQVKTTN